MFIEFLFKFALLINHILEEVHFLLLFVYRVSLIVYAVLLLYFDNIRCEGTSLHHREFVYYRSHIHSATRDNTFTLVFFLHFLDEGPDSRHRLIIGRRVDVFSLARHDL